MFVEHFSLYPVIYPAHGNSALASELAELPKCTLLMVRAQRKEGRDWVTEVQSISRTAVLRGNPDSAVGSELRGHVSLKLAGYSVVSFT